MTEEFLGGYCQMVEPQPSPWEKIGPIAKRLGVQPTEQVTGGITCLSDGKWYDIFDVVNAFLDKIDAAQK